MKINASLKDIRREAPLSEINLDIIIALFPSLFWAVFAHGTHALLLLLTSVVTSVIADVLIAALLKRRILSFLDLSSTVCGLLLALLVPASLSVTLVAVMAFSSVILSRAIPFFERLPICSPAAVLAVASLLAKNELTAFPALERTMSGNPTSSAVYPITSLIAETTPDNQWYELFFGSVCGPMGTVSVLLIIAGAAYLFSRRISSVKAVVGFMAGVAACAYFITGSANPFEVVLYTCLTGQFLFGAVFCVSLPMWTVTDTRFNILIPAIGGAISVLVAFKFSLLAVPVAVLAVGALSALSTALPPAQAPFGGK